MNIIFNPADTERIIPAIQLAIQETYFKNFCIMWDVVKAEDITK